MKLDYLDGFDYQAVHERAKYVLENTKRLKPSAEKECLDWFEQNCATSKTTIEEAKSAIPGGVQHNLANNYPFALNCVKGEGAYLFDIDGNRYVDFIGAGGPSILGNNDPDVRQALEECLDSTGYLTGLYHENEYKVAQKVKEFFPSVKNSVCSARARKPACSPFVLRVLTPESCISLSSRAISMAIPISSSMICATAVP